jgi:hypothetical protein
MRWALVLALGIMTALHLSAVAALEGQKARTARMSRLNAQCAALQFETERHLYRQQILPLGWQDFDRKRPT